MVAEQGRASFDHSSDTNPASQKLTAGKGNVVNPLELSPATPELSYSVETTVCICPLHGICDHVVSLKNLMEDGALMNCRE